MTQDKKLITDTRSALTSGNTKTILKKLYELKSSGSVNILPFILDLLTDDKADQEIVREVLHLISDLKDQECAVVVAKYIDDQKFGIHLAGVLSSCWQSRLDYSAFMETFVNCFVSGNFQEALESFTVIEEMLWRSSGPSINSCKTILQKRKMEIGDTKELLFQELVKVLARGESANRENYPDMYDR
jgi:hypothetical protein